MTTEKKGAAWQYDSSWREHVTIAKELAYNIGVVNKLKAEPNHHARVRILRDARMGKYDKKRS